VSDDIRDEIVNLLTVAGVILSNDGQRWHSATPREAGMIADAILPIIHTHLQTARETELQKAADACQAAITQWRDGNRDDRRRRQGLRQAIKIINDRLPRADQ
jgi:hypothetical protein